MIAITSSLVVAPGASADGRGDGLYGRWDRALTLGIGAGAGATLHDGDARLTGVAELRLLIADVGGPVVAGRWGPDAGQYLFTGVDVRPLFPALFFLMLPTWREFWDLTIQSISVELGAAFPLEGEHDAAFAYGFSFGIPIARFGHQPHRLWLRMGARHVNASRAFRNTPRAGSISEWTTFGALVIDLSVAKRLGSWEPPRYRGR